MGRPKQLACKNGHVNPPRGKNYGCLICMKETGRRWELNNIARLRLKQRLADEKRNSPDGQASIGMVIWLFGLINYGLDRDYDTCMNHVKIEDWKGFKPNGR